VLKTVLAEEKALQLTDNVFRCPSVALSSFAPFERESSSKVEVKLALAGANSRIIDL